jgi:hypothetical protein
MPIRTDVWLLIILGLDNVLFDTLFRIKKFFVIGKKQLYNETEGNYDVDSTLSDTN